MKLIAPYSGVEVDAEGAAADSLRARGFAPKASSAPAPKAAPEKAQPARKRPAKPKE